MRAPLWRLDLRIGPEAIVAPMAFRKRESQVE